jgi:hypothetical protein
MALDEGLQQKVQWFDAYGTFTYGVDRVSMANRQIII